MFSQGYRPGIVYVSLSAFSHVGPWASRRGFDTVVQTVSGITSRQGELFPGAAPGPQFYPVSAIDYLTGSLMAFGALVALARRAREGGSWLVRISLAQTGRWLVGRGEVPEAALMDVPKEFTPAELERWSMTSDTPVGRLRHLGLVVRLSETPPHWARPSVPLGYPRASVAGAGHVATPGRQREARSGAAPLAPGWRMAALKGRSRMKFLAITLITHVPDPVTGIQQSTTERLRDVVENAVLAEELGFDGYGVGERHERPFISSSPPVVLSHIAARTSTIRLFTTVTTLSLLDPVRAFEDYATLDHLSGGRLELIIGKGNGAAQARLFHVTTEDQWARNREGYELFRRLWREDKVTWSGRFRPALDEAETWPRPLQQPIRVWHGSATSQESVDLAAQWGDPLFSANVTNPIEPYAALVRYYRERWAFYGHDPADALVGAGTAGYYAAKTSQDAIATYRPIFEARLAAFRRRGIQPVFHALEDAIARSSALIGSPQQIIEKVHRYHEQMGHEVLHLHADGDGLTKKQHRATLELFQSAIAPVLRREMPSRPFPPAPACVTARVDRE